MGKILGNLGKNTTDLDDEVIMTKMLASSKAASKAYLSAVMCSTAPELRNFFSNYLQQVMAEHATLTELAIKKKWLEPYNTTRYQLRKTYLKSKHLLHQDQ